MGLAKGLAAMQDAQDKSTFSNDGPKVEWLKLKDGERVTVRFINELDEESPYFIAANDVALVAEEHTNPNDFKRKMVCTRDTEGQCVGCENYAKETKESRGTKGSWRGKYRFYINLLVNDGKKDPYVAVWSQGLTKQSAFNMLKEYYGETQGITNLTWKLTRQGEGTDTTYTLMPNPLGPDKEPFDWDGVEPFPLEAVVRQIAYVDQEKFLFGHDTPKGEAKNLASEW